MLFGACSELEVRESDRLFFCGQGQSRLAKQARVICAVVRCRESASSSPSATPKRPNTGYAAGPPRATAASARAISLVALSLFPRTFLNSGVGEDFVMFP
jgi:hypothetical protein